MARVRKEGALSIRDIDDDELVEKDHPWASRKPSKRALQMAFFAGLLTVSERAGMVKTYELTDRHFGWAKRPRAASEAQVNDYLLDRALRAQGIVSLDSVCHLDAARKPRHRRRDRRPRPPPPAGARRGRRRRPDDALDGPRDGGGPSRARPRASSTSSRPSTRSSSSASGSSLLFGYDHRFEAYVPKEKRVLGYFALPVLVGERDRRRHRPEGRPGGRAAPVQQWTWIGEGSEAEHKAPIEEALHRFERFQLDA